MGGFLARVFFNFLRNAKPTTTHASLYPRLAVPSRVADNQQIWYEKSMLAINCYSASVSIQLTHSPIV
jgi:hypothetical protein